MEFERIADKKRVDFIVASIRNSVPFGGEILDIGCGNGIISRAVGTYGYNVLGIDSSEKTIANAIADNMVYHSIGKNTDSSCQQFKIALPNVSFKVVDAGELTLAGNELNGTPGKLNIEALKYDAIICSEVLEHLHEPAELLNVIYKLLKDDGILIVTVPNGKGPRELLVTRPVQYLQKSNGLMWKIMSKIKSAMGYTGTTVQSSADDLSHLQFFTIKRLDQLAAASHFRIIQIRSSNFIEQVFPFSLLARRSKPLQRFDCRLADALPLSFTSGFMSIWNKL